MRDLNEIRSDFNQVDEELSRLFAKRMALAREIAALKLSEGKAIYDPQREKEVIEKRKAAFPDADPEFLDELERLYILLMQLSKEEQQRVFKQADEREIAIYTDGACSGNPGPGGYGCVLMFTDENGTLHQKELSAGYAKTTNNRMEILAVIAALELVKKPCRITLYSDSQYVVKAFTEGWLEKWQRFDWHKDAKKKESVKNKDLWVRLLEAAKPHTISYVWVKGHAENDWNNRCDQLAVTASMDRVNWKIDEGYTES